MSRFFTSAAIGLLIILVAATGFAAELYEDPATGQLYTKPGEGRTLVGVPAEKMGALYEDPESGAVFTKPGDGRRAVTAEAPMSSPAEEQPAGDYSTQAFTEAVRHVVSEDSSTTYPKVKIGGEAYVGYLYDFDNESAGEHGRNKFSLNRGYINLKAELLPQVRVRITPDISRESLSVTSSTSGLADGESVTVTEKDNFNGDYKFRLKYYYIAFHDFWDLYPSLQVKAGQFEGAWLDHDEHLWTYRVQGTMMVEREGFMNSANLGVDFQGKLPAGYGEWQANFVNGEGYHADEKNKYKSVQGRLTLHPLPQNDYTKGFELTGFYFGGKEDQAHNRDRAIAFVGYKYQNRLFVGGEYLSTHGNDKYVSAHDGINNIAGGGTSVLGWYRMPFAEPVRLMARWDHFDHDLDSPNNTVNRYIYGVSYDINKYATLLVDNERTVAKGYKGGYTKSLYKDENLLKLDLLVKFN